MIQPLKTDDWGTEKPDSISCPLCSDYTFIREPVSLLLELAEFRNSKAWQRAVLLFGVIFHLREVAWLGHCCSICFSFHCGPLSTDRGSVGPTTALLHKLSAGIFHAQTPEFQCLSIRVCNV